MAEEMPGSEPSESAASSDEEPAESPGEEPVASPETASDPSPAEEPATRSQPHHQCPECEKRTIPSSDKCQHCGAPLDSGSGISMELWEWGGGLVAAFGFFLTPVLPGPIALYCAYRVYQYKPRAALGILLMILATIIFWIVLPLFILP